MLKSKSYIYRFIDSNKKIIYVGKTNNLDKRYIQHFKKNGHLSKECYESVWKIEYITVDNEINALLLETYYINKFRPKYNKLNKTYRATSMDNVNLKTIKDNWKIYKIVNDSLVPNSTEKKLSFKENLFFYSLTIICVVVVTIIYFKNCP